MLSIGEGGERREIHHPVRAIAIAREATREATRHIPVSNRSLREQEGAAASPLPPENAKPRRARRENARTHRELLALLDDTMKLDKDPSEQEEQLRRKRSSRKNEKQRGAARAATIAFDSDEWDEMVGAGWSVKDSSSLLLLAQDTFLRRGARTRTSDS